MWKTFSVVLNEHSLEVCQLYKVDRGPKLKVLCIPPAILPVLSLAFAHITPMRIFNEIFCYKPSTL